LLVSNRWYNSNKHKDTQHNKCNYNNQYRMPNYDTQNNEAIIEAAAFCQILNSK
jgi:hypothetical protein